MPCCFGISKQAARPQDRLKNGVVYMYHELGMPVLFMIPMVAYEEKIECQTKKRSV